MSRTISRLSWNQTFSCDVSGKTGREQGEFSGPAHSQNVWAYSLHHYELKQAQVCIIAYCRVLFRSGQIWRCGYRAGPTLNPEHQQLASQEPQIPPSTCISIVSVYFYIIYLFSYFFFFACSKCFKTLKMSTGITDVIFECNFSRYMYVTPICPCHTLTYSEGSLSKGWLKKGVI